MPVTLSITETQVLAALVAVLQSFGLATAAGAALPIVRGQINRVPTPQSADYAVLWPLGQTRLEFNIEAYADNTSVGSISANVLTVTAVTVGALAAGQTLYGANITGTPAIVMQTSGPAGGIGTYTLDTSLTAASGAIYSGTRAMMQPQDVGVQIDIHGPSSAGNATLLTTQWFSQAGVDACIAQGGIIAPLYAADPRQVAFVNDQDQWEERWVIDLHLQVNPVVTITQQFADQLTATAEAVESLA